MHLHKDPQLVSHLASGRLHQKVRSGANSQKRSVRHSLGLDLVAVGLI